MEVEIKEKILKYKYWFIGAIIAIVLAISFQDTLYKSYKYFIAERDPSIDYKIGFYWLFGFIDLNNTTKLSKVLWFIVPINIVIILLSLVQPEQGGITKKIITIALSPLISVAIILLMLLITILASLLLGPAIYSLYNFFHQDYMNISFWKEEVSNGFLAVRIMAVTLLIYLILFSHKNTKIDNKIKLKAKKKLKLFTKRKRIKNDLKISKDELGYIMFFNHTSAIVYYNIIVIYLIMHKIIGVESLFIPLLSWGLFFIVDDWKIIADYTHEFKRKIMFWHLFKLKLINYLLISLLIVATFEMFTIIEACLIISIPLVLFSFKNSNDNFLYSISKIYENQKI